jgi:hypothetical protein
MTAFWYNSFDKQPYSYVRAVSRQEFHIEPIKNNYDAGMYITKHFNINTLTESDIVWDIIQK